MKRRVLVLVIGFLFIGINGFAANGDLIVNGNVGVGTTTPQYSLDIISSNNGIIRLGSSEADGTPKVARLVLRHYNYAEEPVYLLGAASIGTNNYVAFGGGSPLGNAATQMDLYTAENATTQVGTSRLTIIGNGYVGFGRQNPFYPLEMASGAYVTTGGVWTNASSREYKDNIEILSTDEAFGTLKELNPVKFSYKTDMTEKHVGFIAEDVPDLIATKDRKGLSPMDVVAVLTKVAQEQQTGMREQQRIIQEQQKEIAGLKAEMDQLKESVYKSVQSLRP